MGEPKIDKDLLDIPNGSFICFSRWSNEPGGRRSFHHKRRLWGRIAHDNDDPRFEPIMDEIARAVRDRYDCDGDTWRFDKYDEFEIVPEGDVPAHVYATIAAQALLGEDE